MKLIVGLGNPGKKYEGTRHNVGFVVIDQLADQNFKLNKKSNSLILKTKIDSKDVILAKPQTFMNSSGQAVAALAGYYKVKPENIIVIHDEIDLPLGTIRISQDSSAAGHNGVQSIINSLGTRNFIRIRIGIDPDSKTIATAEPRDLKLNNFVLNKFTAKEEKIVKKVIDQAVKALQTIITENVTVAMNKHN
ncbi:MAG TPA: aminoacyl-tRNA hydrolase [Patescibacteria group bacterium]